MLVGDELKLEIEIKPENADIKTIEWRSSDDNVISADDEGNIKAVKSGNATIFVAVNNVEDSCKIEVMNANSITFKNLSEIAESGVTVEDGAYVVSSDLEIKEGETLLLNEDCTIKLRNDIKITIEGTIDFRPETSATMTRYDETHQPKYIYITGEQSGGDIRNMSFIDVPIRVFAGKPLTVDNSEFKYISTNRAALDMGTSALVTVTNCKFIENGYPAISGASNGATPLVFKNNYLYKNSANARNRPQINVTVAGDELVEISNNEVIGPGEITTNGGIAVSNLLGIKGTNKVIIEGNSVKDCRYGITTNGQMDVRIIKNTLVDNKYESNAMNGGSGISIYNNKGGQKVFISENIIKNNLWGITLIGDPTNGTGPIVNMGNLTEGSDYNIGKNVFENNANNGVKYDLYNNSPLDVPAVNNTWGSVDQTEAEIEKVIFHKNDDEKLGKVTFMPPYKS